MREPGEFRALQPGLAMFYLRLPNTFGYERKARKAEATSAAPDQCGMWP
jgi:hypothetical protein